MPQRSVDGDMLHHVTNVDPSPGRDVPGRDAAADPPLSVARTRRCGATALRLRSPARLQRGRCHVARLWVYRPVEGGRRRGVLGDGRGRTAQARGRGDCAVRRHCGHASPGETPAQSPDKSPTKFYGGRGPQPTSIRRPEQRPETNRHDASWDSEELPFSPPTPPSPLPCCPRTPPPPPPGPSRRPSAPRPHVTRPAGGRRLIF